MLLLVSAKCGLPAPPVFGVFASPRFHTFNPGVFPFSCFRRFRVLSHEHGITCLKLVRSMLKATGGGGIELASVEGAGIHATSIQHGLPRGDRAETWL